MFRTNPRESSKQTMHRQGHLSQRIGHAFALPVVIVLALSTGCSAHPMNDQGTLPTGLQLSGAAAIAPDNASSLTLAAQVGKGVASCLAWSADGTHLTVVASRGVFTYDANTFKLDKFVPLELRGECWSITPNGKYFVAGNMDERSKLQVWNTQTGRVQQTLAIDPMAWRDQISISPSGRWVVISLAPGLQLRDVATGKQSHTFRSRGFAYAFDPGERLLAFPAENKTLEVRETGSFTLTQTMPTSAYQRLALSPSGKHLVTQDDGIAEVWDLETTHKVLTMTVSPWRDTPPGHGTVFVNEQTLLSINYQWVKLWSAETGQVLQEAQVPDGVYQFAVSPDGRKVALITSLKDRLVVYDLATWKEVGLVRGHASVTDLSFHPSAPVLAAGWQDNRVWLVNLASGKTDILEGATDEIENTVAFSKKGDLLATGNRAGAVYLRDFATRKLLHTLRGEMGVSSLSFSADGSQLASAVGHHINAWNVATGDPVLNCECNDKYFLFNPGNGLAATGGFYGVVLSNPDLSGYGHTLWGLSIPRGADVVESPFISLAFSSDGKLLAAGFREQVHVWDVATEKELLVFKVPGDALDVTFSPDGRLIASANRVAGAQVWDTQTGKLVTAIPVYHASSIAFSSDGTLLAVGSEEGTIHLYRAAAPRPLQAMAGYPPYLLAVLFIGLILIVWGTVMERKKRPPPVVGLKGDEYGHTTNKP